MPPMIPYNDCEKTRVLIMSCIMRSINPNKGMPVLREDLFLVLGLYYKYESICRQA